MSYRAVVEGCYVLFSPSLHAAYRTVFPEAHGCTLAKIGSSDDIFQRIDELQGRVSDRSIGCFAVDRHGWGHISDWALWTYTTKLNGLTALDRERQLQSCHRPLGPDQWRRLHDALSTRRYVPQLKELFVVRPERLREDFIVFPIRPEI
jgi:hypothetical protein